MDEIITTDGFHVEIYVYNTRDYSAHVFVSRNHGEYVNSSNSDVFHIHGRDTYEVLIREAKRMNLSEVKQMFGFTR